MAVEQRRQELGRTQAALASFGGPGVVTVGKIERGEIRQPQASTLNALDRSLQWRQGSAAAILDGREATPLDDNETNPDAELIAAIRNHPRLLPEAKEHLEKQYALLLRIAGTQGAQPPEEDPSHDEVTDRMTTSLAKLSGVRDTLPASSSRARPNRRK